LPFLTICRVVEILEGSAKSATTLGVAGLDTFTTVKYERLGAVESFAMYK
jgi:hypothetical protein